MHNRWKIIITKERKLKMKTFIIIASFLALNFVSSGSIEASSTTRHDFIQTAADKANFDDGYIYVKVCINGVWWVIVYDTDGNIVNIYEDEE
jgi:hypothetical protein